MRASLFPSVNHHHDPLEEEEDLALKTCVYNKKGE